MLIFDEELIIKKVIVLVYMSTHEGEIMSCLWLKQFVGKCKDEVMEIDKDIDSISGAIRSAPFITKRVKDISLLIVKIKANKNN